MSYTGPDYNNIIIETLYDASISILSSTSVIVPGGTTVLSAELINKGNGPTSVLVSLVDAPSSWTYSIRMNGVILETTTIGLGVSYTGDERIEFELLLHVPMTEAAGEFHTISIRVDTEGEDIHPDDNDASVDMITGSVKFPEYNGSVLDIHAMVGSTQRLDGTLTNVGNALESSMDIQFELSTSPPTTGVVAFLTAGVGGPTAEEGETLTFPMSAGTSKLIFIDVVIGEDVPLNTRIVITTTVEGGQNLEGDIVKIGHQNLITVDQQRKVELSFSNIGNDSIESTAIAWVNLTSMSTQTEDLTFSFAYPEDWQVMCDGMLIASGDLINTSLPYVRNSDSLKDIRCELQRLGGVYEGEIILTASTIDGEIEFTETRNLEFVKPSEEDSFFASNLNGPTLVASGLGVAILVAILLIIRKQRIALDEDEEETFIAGPPITQQVGVETEPQPEEPAVNSPTVPPLPPEGLPAGWSMEQWVHYGQQYLDRVGKQP